MIIQHFTYSYKKQIPLRNNTKYKQPINDSKAHIKHIQCIAKYILKKKKSNIGKTIETQSITYNEIVNSYKRFSQIHRDIPNITKPIQTDSKKQATHSKLYHIYQNIMRRYRDP